jgi:MarR family transcriptional regulator, organic hydroperoxide resistance regulator
MRQAEQVRYLILAAQREGNRRLTADLAPLNLTPAQSEVLRILAESQPMTLTALGSQLVCESGTNPSRLVDRTVDAGLVERTADAADRRRVTLTLTAKGAAAEARVREVEDRLYGDVEAGLAGIDVTGVIEFLRRASAGQSSGVALANRIAKAG